MKRSKQTRLRRTPFESLEPRRLLAGDLVAQWRAHDLIEAVEDGEPITAWLDSVSGRLAQADGNPLLDANAIGGRAVVRFDPSDQKDFFTISVADNPLSNADDFTIAALFATPAADLQGGVDHWHSATGLVHANRLGFARDWGITLNSDGIPATGLGGGFGEPSTSLFGDQSVNDGQPHLIIVTRAGGNLALYVDETEPVTASGPNSEARDPLTAEFGLSHIHEGELDAEIAEIRFYDGALTEEEVRSLYAEVMAFYTNEPPIAIPDSYRVPEDEILVPNAAQGVLRNDLDADSDLLTAELLSAPAHGELALKPDGSFIYVPERDFVGIDTFRYSAVDFRPSEPVTVTIEVTPTYDAAVGSPDEYQSEPGQVLTVPDLEGVLANDINVDGLPLIAVLESRPSFGDVQLAANGGFTFDPLGSSGITTFTYRIDDGVALSSDTVVTVIVNSAPVAANDTYRLSEDNVLWVDASNGVIANDFDAEMDTLSVMLVADAQNGQLALSEDGSFSYQPTTDFFGRDTFTYEITDGIETSAEATVELIVESVNDLPVAVDDAYFVEANQQLSISVERGVLRNDVDVEPPLLLSATLATDASKGQLALASDGSFVYHPHANFFGEDTFSYEVWDADGGSAVGQVQLFVGIAPVRINEFMAANATTLSTRIRQTPDDRFPRDRTSPDWVELVNQTEQPIDISGFHLTDDSSGVAVWTFPSGTTIPALGYLVVFLSGFSVTDPQLDESGLLHADFKLDAKGDSLFLTSPDGTLVDAIRGPFPEQIADVSYGLTESGYMYLPLPTPGAANSSEAFPGIAQATDVSIPAGYYDAPIRVQLTSETPDSTIRYTLDGSDPTEANGQVYTDPIDIRETTLLRTRVLRDGLLPSASVTYSYLYLDEVLTQSERPEGFPSTWGRAGRADYEMDPRIATDVTSRYYDADLRAALQSHDAISIVTDMNDLFDRDTGIYSNPQREGPAWERSASMELISADGNSQFQINAGLRIQGASRNPNRPKHNLRFLFKETYGESKLVYPFFPDSPIETLDTLILRGGNGDSWFHPNANQQNQAQYIRDQWHKQTQQLMGHTFVPQRYVHVFVNGLYWGFYHAYEKPNAAFFAERFGGEPEEYDVLQHKNGVVDGTRETWNSIISFARDGLESEAAFEFVKQQVDIPAFIEYLLFNFYSGNIDWDQNNWFGGRKREDGKFIFFTWDAERTFLNPGDNRTAVYNASQPSDLHRRLSENDEYRMLFADIAQQHLFHRGLLTPESASARWQALADEIALPLVAESARWGDNKRPSRPYTRDVEWQRELDRLMTSYFPNRTQTVLRQLRQRSLYPDTTAPTFNQHGGVFDVGFRLTMTAPEGTIYFTTDGSDPRQVGGELSPTAIEYAQGIALLGDVNVKARVLLDGEWSALNQADFLAPSVAASGESLRVSEINYHPSPPTVQEIAAGFDDDDDFEFLELMNISQQTIDLSTVQIVRDDGGGVDFEFDTAQVRRLAPGDRLVVVEDIRAFTYRYGSDIPIAGQWSGRLSNGGETINVVAEDNVIQRFAYDDAWYPTTDGDGHTLEIVDPAGDDLLAWSRATGWRASVQPGGTPGRGPDPVLPGDSNHDGVFNSSDLVLVFQVGEYEDHLVGNSTFEDGDWNGDGDFDSQDFVFVFQLGTYVAQARPSRLCLKSPLPAGERLGEGPKPREMQPSSNPSLKGRGTFETKPSRIDIRIEWPQPDTPRKRLLQPAVEGMQFGVETTEWGRRRRLHILSVDLICRQADFDDLTAVPDPLAACDIIERDGFSIE